MKFGETAAGYFKRSGMQHILKRTYKQIQKLIKKYGPDFDYKEIGKFATKREARVCETTKIREAKVFDQKACPLNKGDH